VNLGDQAAKLRDMERDMDRQKAAAGGRTDVTRGDFGFASAYPAGGRVTREAGTHTPQHQMARTRARVPFTVRRPPRRNWPARLVAARSATNRTSTCTSSRDAVTMDTIHSDLLATDWWIIPRRPPGSEAGARVAAPTRPRARDRALDETPVEAANYRPLAGS